MDTNERALVIAAGKGPRVRSLTTMRSGTALTAQFCSLRDSPLLLEEASHRGRNGLASDQHLHDRPRAAPPLVEGDHCHRGRLKTCSQTENRSTALGPR